MDLEEFKDFDHVAVASFDFLVRERGAGGPSVIQGGGFTLAYELAENLSFQVGWVIDDPGPTLRLLYRPYQQGYLFFDLHLVLDHLGALGEGADKEGSEKNAEVSSGQGESQGQHFRSRKAEWAEILDPYAQDLNHAYDRVLEYVKENTSEAHFVEPNYPAPLRGVDREIFWKIVDSGRFVSTTETSCPSCGYVGYVGVEDQITTVGGFLRQTGYTCGTLGFLSLIGWRLELWPSHIPAMPLTLLLFALCAVCLFVAGTQSSRLIWCPRCETP